MTSKKDPPIKPSASPAPAQVDPLAGQPIEVVIEVLATAGGKMQGLDGSALKQHVAGAITEAQRVVADVERRATEEEQRKAAATEIETLIDTLIRTGTPIARSLESQREPIVNAFKVADLQNLAAGMQQLVEWMGSPTAANDKAAAALLERLEKTLGPVFGINPEAAEQGRREQMKADVQKSLDDAFRGKDFAATLKKKPE
jgi:hypothetical protein